MRILAGLAVLAACSAFAGLAHADGDPPPPPEPALTEPAAEPAPPAEPETAPPPPPRPTVRVDAKDDLGHDVHAATVFVDDKPVAYELDGKLIELDPGPHTITLQRNDGPRVRTSISVTLALGEMGHPVHGFFPHSDEPAHVVMDRSEPPLVPRIVVGAGLVAMATGALLVLARPVSASNCAATCTRLAGESDADYSTDRSTARRSQGLLHAGTITVAAGGGVAALGLLWYFLQYPPGRNRSAMIAPWLAPSTGGVAASGSF